MNCCVTYLFWVFWEISTLGILSANCCKVLMGLSEHQNSKKSDAIISCTCILQFLIYYWNVTCELEVGNLSWIDSDSSGQLRAHSSMSWSRGSWEGVRKLMFHLSLLLISRKWSIHGTESHILSGICFSYGSSAAQRLDNDVLDLNKIRKIIYLDFGIMMERSSPN